MYRALFSWRLRREQLQLRGRTERVALLLHAQVFLRCLERRLLDGNARLGELELSEVLHELLVREHLRVAQRGAGIHLT